MAFDLASPGVAAAQTPPEIGLTTAVKDLAGALMENASLAANIKEGLGISTPNTVNASAPTDKSASLVSVIRGMTGQVYSTNKNLMDVLQHIHN
jgi:hypothetical protein